MFVIFYKFEFLLEIALAITPPTSPPGRKKKKKLSN